MCTGEEEITVVRLPSSHLRLFSKCGIRDRLCIIRLGLYGRVYHNLRLHTDSKLDYAHAPTGKERKGRYRITVRKRIDRDDISTQGLAIG